MMEKIMDLCKKLDIRFELIYDPVMRGFMFHFSKSYDTETHHIEDILDLDIYNDSTFDMNNFLGHICHNIEYNFAAPVDTNVESILKRADVVWRDEMNFSASIGRRIVTSRNTVAPLTVFEKDMIRRMWRNKGYIGPVLFEVKGE